MCYKGQGYPLNKKMSKVFIIDDDIIHQRIVQIMIEKHRIYKEYQSFTNAAKVLEILGNQSDADALPDIILLDLNMPILDGWGFLERFELLYPKLSKPLKVFIVSSSIDEKDMLRSQNYPFVKGFISKPISPDDLRNTL